MSLVDVIMTVGENDKVTDYDCRVMDALENMYPASRSYHREGLLPRVNKVLDRASRNTWIGRRPIELDRCLVVDDSYTYLLVVLPLGSTWRAVNSGYMFLKDQLALTDLAEHDSYEMSSTVRDYAHKNIIPLLDTKGEFSRYPFDVQIAFDLMFTLKLALTRGQIGKGSAETIDSVYIDIPNHIYTPELNNRETRQLALCFKYKPLPM
ncbi:hypothetical protein D3C85_747250 [compost metagenome]